MTTKSKSRRRTIVAIGDAHLGHYPAPAGSDYSLINRVLQIRRKAFRSACRMAADLDLENPVFTISGDVFTAREPSGLDDYLSFLMGVLEIHSRHPEARIIITYGNHDKPRRDKFGSGLAWHDLFGLSELLAEAEIDRSTFPRPQQGSAGLDVDGMAVFDSASMQEIIRTGSAMWPDGTDVAIGHFIIPQAIGVPVPEGMEDMLPALRRISRIWILNDIHTPIHYHKGSDVAIIYPGCVNPTSTGDSDAGGVALVETSGNQVESVEFMRPEKKPVLAKATIRTPADAERAENEYRRLMDAKSSPTILLASDDGTEESRRLVADLFALSCGLPGFAVIPAGESVEDSGNGGESEPESGIRDDIGFSDAISIYARERKFDPEAEEMARLVASGETPKEALQQCLSNQ